MNKQADEGCLVLTQRQGALWEAAVLELQVLRRAVLVLSDHTYQRPVKTEL